MQRFQPGQTYLSLSSLAYSLPVTPSVRLAQAQLLHPDWIQVHVASQFQTPTWPIHQHRLEAPLEQVPRSLVARELERMVAAAREDLKKRGVKDAETAPLPQDLFDAQAERRVRLGLVVAELVRAHQLQAKPEQLQKQIEEMSQSYEKPAEVMRWYLSDRDRMAEIEAMVIENNVTEFVLARAKVNAKLLPFDELMSA